MSKLLTPEQKARYRSKRQAKRKQRYADDPEYRDKLLKESSNYKARTKESKREERLARDRAYYRKRAQDPAFLEKRRQYKQSERYKELQRARARERYRNDPEYRERILGYNKGPEARFKIVNYRHGMTSDEFFSLYEFQEGKCAICSKLFDGPMSYSVHRDHNHDTGEVRRLLCKRCNTQVGFYEKKWPSNLIDYVNNPPRKKLSK